MFTCAGGLAATDEERLETGGAGALEVFDTAVADVKDGRGGESELVGGKVEHRGIGFGMAHLGGDDNAVKPNIEVQRLEERAEALVPIGDCCELDAAPA